MYIQNKTILFIVKIHNFPADSYGKPTFTLALYTTINRQKVACLFIPVNESAGLRLWLMINRDIYFSKYILYVLSSV